MKRCVGCLDAKIRLTAEKQRSEALFVMLAAIIGKYGGEIRLSAADIVACPLRPVIVKTDDAETGDRIFRLQP